MYVQEVLPKFHGIITIHDWARLLGHEVENQTKHKKLIFTTHSGPKGGPYDLPGGCRLPATS